MSALESGRTAAAADGETAAAERSAGEGPVPAEGIVCLLAQTAPRLGDVERNVAAHLEVLAEARRGDADLVVFPELSLTGYFLKDLVPDVALRLDAPEVTALAEATRGGPDAIVGLVHESPDHRFLNAAVHLSGGRVAFVHHKLYLPTYGLFDEHRYLAAGRRLRTHRRGPRRPPGRTRWPLGILVCEDIWHPAAPSLLAREGMDLLAVPSSSPGRGVGVGPVLGTAASYDNMTRTYAQLLTCFVVYCNRVGYEDGVGFWGGSRVVGPDGLPLATPAGTDEALVWHRLERGALRRARLQAPLLRDARHDLLDAEAARLRSRRR